MNKARADQHLKAATAYIAVAESGDAKRVAYEKAADEILAAKADDPKLTHTEIGRRVGKGKRWVGTLMKWRQEAHAHALPFARGEAQQRYAERQVPTRHKDKVEMAEKLLADRTVAEAVVKKSSEASRRIQHAVHERDSDRLRQVAEQHRLQQETRARVMPPLPTHMAAMVMKMNQWSAGLAGITDEDLDGLPDGRGRDLVGEAASELTRQGQRWVKRLKKPAMLRVIEGRAARG